MLNPCNPTMRRKLPQSSGGFQLNAGCSGLKMYNIISSCQPVLAGVHKHVDPAILRQARTFAKYATTVYGASFIEWLEKR
jgi:hypothetical protein